MLVTWKTRTRLRRRTLMTACQRRCVSCHMAQAHSSPKASPTKQDAAGKAHSAHLQGHYVGDTSAEASHHLCHRALTAAGQEHLPLDSGHPTHKVKGPSKASQTCMHMHTHRPSRSSTSPLHAEARLTAAPLPHWPRHTGQQAPGCRGTGSSGRLHGCAAPTGAWGRGRPARPARSGLL